MRPLRLLLAAVVLLLGWGALVAVAIVLGARASSGSEPWRDAIVAAVGAAVCLVLAMLAWTRRAAVRRGDVAVRRTPSHRA
jgi:arginine exporter protein ArgO